MYKKITNYFKIKNKTQINIYIINMTQIIKKNYDCK